MTKNPHTQSSLIVASEHTRLVTAIVMNDGHDAVLMVKQPIHTERNTNDLSRKNIFWLPPGCAVHDGETIRHASQKIEKESGIDLCDDARHVYTSTCFMTSGQYRQTVSGFLCSVKSDTPRHSGASDSKALDICWMPLVVAMRHIARMPDIGYREPLLNYLANGKTISYWSYGVLNDGHSIRSFPLDSDLYGKTNLIP